MASCRAVGWPRLSISSGSSAVTPPECWQDFAYEVNNLDLTDRQYRLVASLWELSRERHLEDIAPRLRTLPDSLCNSFR